MLLISPDKSKLNPDNMDFNTENFALLINELHRIGTLCEYLDNVIESSSDGIYICDGNGMTIGVNKAYESMCGADRRDIIGKNVKLLVKELLATDAGSLAVLEKKQPMNIQYEFTLTAKKALVSCEPIFNDSGELTMIVSTVRDITELEILKENLTQVEHLAHKYKEEIKLVKSQLIGISDIVAEDEKTIDLLYNTGKVAKVNATVIITGETGVGKEIIAKYIYNNSKRNDKVFVKINCGAIPENLIESELFGYEKGAFTGARNEGRMGLFELSDKGTIFLDEIGELSMDMQVKLLRVLQEREIVRIGSNKPIKIDVRIISATNRNLKDMVEKHQFREDLYYRLNVLTLFVPPVRERKNDIIPLVQYFLKEANSTYQLNKSFTNSALQVFMDYSWPGNVREIKNVVERVVIMSDSDFISTKDLSINNMGTPLTDLFETGIDLKEILERIEFDYMNKAYSKFKSLRAAASYLGMTKPTFIRKRKFYSDKFSPYTNTDNCL